MKCTECGREIGDNPKFCKYCGTSVKQIHVSVENTNQTMKCKGCGAVLKEGTAFCTQCGTPVSATTNIPFTKENVKAKGSKVGKIIIIVITVIALSLIGFICFYFAGQRGIFDRDGKDNMKTSSKDIESNESVNEEPKTTESMLNDEIQQEESTAAENIDIMDVEAIVMRIRDRYDQIVNGISSSTYDILMIDERTLAYSEQGQIQAIVIKNNDGRSEYTQYFYYDEGELFFAYYESVDSHRFYFEGDGLIRWRYCPDASDNSKATNYDLENTSEYYRWQNDVLAESEKLSEAWEDALVNRDNDIQEYVLAGSNVRYISKSELREFTAEQCRLARNEIYARHGRMFDDEYLQEYFDSKEWYVPSIAPGDFQESLLNSYEIANRDLIVEYEKECGYR